MKVKLPSEDADQVRAILLTHAEMQDQRAMQQEQELGLRLKEFPGHDAEADIEDIDDCIDDRDNLKRIANLFGAD